MDQHGTRALQVLLEECIKINKPCKKTTAISKLLVEALEKGNRTLEMMTNIRGNHVIKQILVLLNPVQR